MTEENIIIEESSLPQIVGHVVDCNTGICTPIYDSEEYQASLAALQAEVDSMRQKEQEKEAAKAALVAATGLTEEQINLLF